VKSLLTLFVTGMFLHFFPNAVKAQKILQTNFVNSPVELDGQLKELFWQTLQPADSFVVNYPDAGAQSAFITEVKLGYDDQAVYIGAILKDVTPDSVLSTLSQRDDFGNADWFGVSIDPYGAGQNAFAFFVTAAGVELDAIFTAEDEDYSWNAVWKSRAIRTEEGWSLEIRIPLSQLRFPDKNIQTWKVNFQRQVRRRREMSFWSPVDPTKYGQITQAGKLEGLTALNSPLRLSFSPYTTGYVENYYNGESQSQDWRFRQRFGLDVKYGLSESFTLDATLVPDFGQTVSDNLVLNLSPFEVKYNENRPFFLEGMDLFGIGELFYTRRIGAPTRNGAFVADSLLTAGNTIVSAPSQAQLVNATKISGRTKKGLGIGVFNAVEKRSWITYRDSMGNEREALAHPLTNYNVSVLSQNLKNNGNISLVNSNVLRPDINNMANVSALQSKILTRNRKHSFFLNAKASYLKNNDKTDLGHNISGGMEKVQGAITWQAQYYEMSDKFDMNDLGYLSRNNMRGFYGFAKWTGYEPTGRFLRRNVKLESGLEYLYKPDRFAYWTIDASSILTFRNFLTTGFEAGVMPFGETDHFESREFGIPVKIPPSVRAGGFYSSDYSKKLALDFSLYSKLFNRKGMANIDAEISPRVRFSNKLFMVLTTGVSRYFNNYGYVHVYDPSYAGKIILGTRNRWIVNNAVSLDYTFTNRMGMILRLNHYWQEVAYLHFDELQNDGRTTSTEYDGTSDNDGTSLHNTSYNAFTVDLNFRWVIYPGSEIRFVWKYNIYASENGLDENYFYTFKDLFSQPQLNSFSVKALFFLDAGKLGKSGNSR